MKNGKYPDPNMIHPIAGYDNEIYVKPTITNPNIIVRDFTYIADSEFESHVTNFYTWSRDLLTADEVRMLDNRYALLFIRGERPVMDFKYDILKHPDVRLTTDGQADPYIHGEPWDAGSTIELVHDPEQIAMAAESIQIPEVIEADYVLLSEEEVEKES